MFIKYKLLSKLAVAVMLITVVTCAFYFAESDRETVSVFDDVVVIDAGHGGVDGGVVGSSGVKESELNLMISRTLKKELERLGYKVVMTRKDSNALAKGKKADMQARKKIIDEAKPDMVVSIHVNKFSDKSRRGAQVFYDDTKKWAKEGMYMQNVLNEFINAKYAGRKNIMALGGDYFMTKCYDGPSLIIECGFISNGEDEKLLTSQEYRSVLAKYIATGIDGILDNGF